MGTRSNIGIQNEDGSYDVIYCHWDGASFSSEYGYIIYAPPAAEGLRIDSYPDELKALLCFAREHDCDYLKLDRDGPTITRFPTYRW